MTCELTIYFTRNDYPGMQSGSVTVPDGSYQSAYMVLTGNGSEYVIKSDGNQGTVIVGGPYNPGSVILNYLSFSSSCDPIPLQVSYDCINGECIKKTQYNTLGIYKSLADCQAVCANGGACAAGKQCVDPTTFCPDGKVCIEQGEFASIEGLISKINSEVC